MKNYRAITTKSIIPIFAILFPFTTLAQSVYVYPTTAVAPRGSYQTVTAIVTGVSNKTVTWSTSGGTLVGTNPCVVNEPCTIALYATTAGTYTVIATSNANGEVAASSTVTITASPTPATTHPRFVVTSSMLPGLQAKATSGNVIYQGIQNYATTYGYNTLSASPYSWSWTTWNGSACAGPGSGLPANSPSVISNMQDEANSFAYLSMVSATSSQRNTWGCAGRDVWVYVMNQIVSGAWTYANLSGNLWSDSSSSFALTTDWLMAGGYLSASDIVLAHQFLYKFAQYTLSFGNGYTPPVTAARNSSAQFDTSVSAQLDPIASVRWMGNNYTMSRILLLTAMGLTFNDNATDDPPLANTCGATRYQVCPDYTAGSLHAYWNYVDGSMLYLDWAHLEDPNVSWQAYQAAYANLPTQPQCGYISGTRYPCFGDGRGGESSEGSYYGYSLIRLRYALNMIHTAGYNDPTIWGPQVSLDTSSWWDLKYVSDAEFLTMFTPQTGVTRAAYNYLTTGDSNTYYRDVADMGTEAALLTADSYVGRTDRSNALLWLQLNTAFGGPLGTSGGCASYCGYDYQIGNPNFSGSSAEDMFISQPAGDPVSALPADPRLSMPTDLYNGSFNQHDMVRSGWNNPTLFSYDCANAIINHEHVRCGEFTIMANGEYITKPRTIFTDYNENMVLTAQSNEPNFVNGANTGDQFDQSSQSNLIPGGLLHAELPGYAAAIVDMTNIYNGQWAYGYPFDVPAYNGVTAASRSLVYLRGSNQVVYYDRGTTGLPAAKATYMIATGSPTINGNTATWSTRSKKQKAYFTTLLPAGAALINNGLPCPKCSVDQVADWEPYAQLEVNASGNPLSTQFLTVLEWSTPGLTQSPTTLVQSTAGQNFDGALIGSSLVMFLRNWPAILTSVTYPASGATTDYISDLRPNTTYAISGAGAPASATTDTAGVLTFVAAGTGNITIRTVAKTGATARLEIPALCTAIALVSSLVTSSRAERFRQ